MPRDAVKYLQPDTDTTGFEWQPAESRYMDETIVALALRFGYAVRQGVVVDGVSLVHADRAERLIESWLNAQEAHDALRRTNSYKMLNQMLPGMAEADAEGDEQIAEGMKRSVMEAREDLRKDLSKPIKQDVAEYWERLGGTVPDLV